MAGKVLIFIVLALAVFWAVVQWRAARHEARAEAAFPPSGRFVEVDGTRVHAVVMGEGPDLVLIHGASGNLRDLTFSLAPRLAERYRVIALDRPGLGYTERLGQRGATIVEQAALLRRAAAELGAERPVVVGHSYGGAVALAWAVEFPDTLSALVSIAGASHPWDSPLDPLYRITSAPLGAALVVPVLTAFVSDSYVQRAINGIFAPQSAPQGYQDHVGAALTLRRVTLRANARQRANILDEIEALHSRYDRISVPVEIVHGTADTTVGLSIHSERLVRDVPRARLTRLDGIGHMPHHVREDAVVAAIDRAASRAGLREED